jgi:ribonuclease VapC
MVLDTSALFAILLGEPEAEACLEQMMSAKDSEISAATLLEARIVAHRRNLEDDLDKLLAALDPLNVIAFDNELSSIAFKAYKTYGPPHPAQLNFGDCFSYATARQRRKPLLFIGNDFKQTDIASVRSGAVSS